MQLSEQYIVIPLLSLLACTAITVARMRDLWAAVMMTGIFSFLGAGWMLVLDAPDVAFTEAAVGAGISTVLMLGTLALTSRTAKPTQRFPWAALAVVLVTGFALIYGTFDLPEYGDPNAPIHQYPKPGYVALEIAKGDHNKSSPTANSPTRAKEAQHEEAQHEEADHGHHEPTPNVVTVVLASYRGFDTLGETTVIFTAGIAVLILLRGPRRENSRP
ncbi:MAG: DUF4040 domain-containing protein [Pirellulaceae bacterium]|nr:DUF4040 domain-containing protein [Pirellulaceae bacterium]